MSYQITPPNHPVEVVASLEQGLLLPANPLGIFILESAMARAQALYPVILCDYLIEGSHIHFIIFVEDPEVLIGFMERFKTESAHYINAMLGRRKRTVWCKGFSRTPILTLSRIIEKIAYIYTNPAKDGLVVSIEDYPGASSWKAFRSGKYRKRCQRLRRPMIPYLPGRFYSKYEYRKQIKLLKNMSKSSHVLTVSPDAWMPFYGVDSPEEKLSVQNEILCLIKTKEQEFERLRKLEGKSVVGAARLISAHLDPDYMPERTGKKMWCLCDDGALRTAYIKWAKEIKQKARDVYERWKVGDFSIPFPPGVCPPAMPKLANMTALACDY